MSYYNPRPRPRPMMPMNQPIGNTAPPPMTSQTPYYPQYQNQMYNPQTLPNTINPNPNPYGMPPVTASVPSIPYNYANPQGTVNVRPTYYMPYTPPTINHVRPNINVMSNPSVISSVPVPNTITSTANVRPSVISAAPVAAAAAVPATKYIPKINYSNTITIKPITGVSATATATTAKTTATTTIPVKSASDLKSKSNTKITDPFTDSSKKKQKKKTVLRSAGGQTWEDDSLLEWDPNDFRLFCGDLGNEVTDDLLGKAFQKYKSFIKARVVRDKRSQKTKGYGFVSFKDPVDFVKAMKEMNGKYIGNRPVKLRKSNWKDRNMDTRRRKPY